MEGLKNIIKKVGLNKVHIGLIIFGSIFVSLSAFHSNLWFDEAYSVGLARHSFYEIWKIGGNDVHPILYYWFLRIIYLLTNGSIIAYRMFSVIPIIIMIILGYTHIRKDFGIKTGIIFSFLSTFLPEMAVYAVEIRMYSWALLTVTILAIYAYRLLKNDEIKNWVIFGIASAISIYLHYYGLMTAGLINIALLIYLIKNKRKKGIIIILTFGIIQAILYIPWLIYLMTQISQVSKGFWIGFTFPTTIIELTSSQLIGYIKYDIPFVLALELYTYLIYKVCICSKLKQDLKPIKMAAGIYFGVIFAALIITIFLKTSILYYRYLFVITGLYIFVISFILGKEKNKITIFSILTVIAILGIFNNIKMIRDNYNISNYEPINYLKENIKENDIIVFSDTGFGFVAKNHFIENKTYFVNEDNWGVEKAYEAFGPNFETVITKDFVNECTNNIWIIDNIDGDFSDYLFKESKNKYKKVEEEKFYTEYHDYNFKITLMIPEKSN